MAYTVIIENKAQKDYLKLSPPHIKPIKEAIDRLNEEPRPHNVKKLSGTKDGYRIRVGDYRILYTIDVHKKVVTIYRRRHRGNVYQ